VRQVEFADEHAIIIARSNETATTHSFVARGFPARCALLVDAAQRTRIVPQPLSCIACVWMACIAS
jgi:hypothetical protein